MCPLHMPLLYSVGVDKIPFYPRATLCVSAVFAVAVCPSVRLSVRLPIMLMDCIHTAEIIVKLLVWPVASSF